MSSFKKQLRCCLITVLYLGDTWLFILFSDMYKYNYKATNENSDLLYGVNWYAYNIQEAEKRNSHVVNDLRQLKYLSDASQSVSLFLCLVFSLSIYMSVCIYNA